MRKVLWVVLAVVVSGCGGGGGGGGDTTDDLPFPATLSSIQEKVFTPTCAPGCHEPGGTAYIETGSGGGVPLDLSSASASFESLVGIQSTVLPRCGASGNESCGLRVAQGDPDNSWLISKLEATNPSFTGDPMPQNKAPLDQETIDVIRQWIAEGAQNN